MNLAIFSAENKPRLRLSIIFFYALILFLPFQTRKVFFTSQSYIHGFHSFYGDIYLYLTDLLFLGLILAWIWESRNFSRERPHCHSLFIEILKKFSNKRIYVLLSGFWLILATSLIFSREMFLGLYGLTKITEFIIIFVYIRENYMLSCERFFVFWLILAISVFQAGLGIFQYLWQRSAGLRILGEEFLRPGIKGIAEFVSHGVANPLFYDFFPYLSPISDVTVNIRAYGTFPHPNILAGFLFFGLMINLYLLYSLKFKEKKWSFHVKSVFLGLSLIIIITGLVLTFSRGVWAVTAFGALAWFAVILVKIRRQEICAIYEMRYSVDVAQYYPQRLGALIGLIILALVFNWFLFGKQICDRLTPPDISSIEIDVTNYSASESVTTRQGFNRIAFAMIKQNPILGVGWKNFVVVMDDYSTERLLPFLHQPVHNIYLLIAAEAGILALLIFLLIIYNIVRHSNRSLAGLWSRKDQALLQGKRVSEIGGSRIIYYTLLIIFFGFLTIGLFDHYLLTIQQGALMFWVVLGFLSANNFSADVN